MEDFTIHPQCVTGLNVNVPFLIATLGLTDSDDAARELLASGEVSLNGVPLLLTRVPVATARNQTISCLGRSWRLL